MRREDKEAKEPKRLVYTYINVNKPACQKVARRLSRWTGRYRRYMDVQEITDPSHWTHWYDPEFPYPDDAVGLMYIRVDFIESWCVSSSNKRHMRNHGYRRNYNPKRCRGLDYVYSKDTVSVEELNVPGDKVTTNLREFLRWVDKDLGPCKELLNREER